MATEFKEVSLEEFELKASGGKNFIEGLASTFGNVDSHGDIVEPGAFKKSLRRVKPKMLWQHMSHKVLGIFEEAKETREGLFVRGRFSDTTLGRDVAELARDGAIDSMSIGYIVRDSDFDTRKNIRTLKELELLEVSLVTFPANDQAKITSAKSAEEVKTVRDFEQFLREAGFSRERAKIIASSGFKANDTGRDAEIGELKELLIQFNKTLGDQRNG